MTTRDRTVLMVVGLLVAAAGFWFLALAPKRDDAAALKTKITAAQGELDAAKAAAATAEEARKRYASDYATVARLGKAVPADDDVPSLLVQLEQAADDAEVDFRTIKVESTGAAAPALATNTAAVAALAAQQKGQSGAGATPAVATEAAAAVLPPGASVGAAGFPTMPFSFEFQGTFKGLESFLDKVTAFTRLKGSTIAVSGRLLTVDGVSLTAGPSGFPQMTAKVAATAYLLPADQASVPAAPGTSQVTPAADAAAASSVTPASSIAPGGTP